MRRFIKNQSLTQQFSRNTVSEYRPEKNDEKLRNWSSRLSNLSTGPASRGYLSQLQALLSYYNKQINDTTKVFNAITPGHRLGKLEFQNHHQRPRFKGQKQLRITQHSRVRFGQDFQRHLLKGFKGSRRYCNCLVYIDRTTKWPSTLWSGLIIMPITLNS